VLQEQPLLQITELLGAAVAVVAEGTLQLFLLKAPPFTTVAVAVVVGKDTTEELEGLLAPLWALGREPLLEMLAQKQQVEVEVRVRAVEALYTMAVLEVR
jgi:hypothetical protein